MQRNTYCPDDFTVKRTDYIYRGPCTVPSTAIRLITHVIYILENPKFSVFYKHLQACNAKTPMLSLIHNIKEKLQVLFKKYS